ncbi:Rqc2 family fibronectin-binding protein [Bacillus chungangensis]|uniref:Rqc2 homolog RqcH n=1 Tax=Bacillus chungangensis TaxID=587633 RepID=A0ABT9WRG3_9BACI|nr:NFACT RNA binding domain-containing protein [Bacillus chungangensis]MDQ0175882.1 putative ribosome quality control (RQC) complex YloA/Tae2 family protein [Bacillus chungangensis]
MAFDGLFTRAMIKELVHLIKGGRINKIHQPYKHELVIVVRANGQNQKVLVSAHPSYSRLQITKEQYENPPEPSNFCMFLRKHIEGYLIEDIYQIELDRIIVFLVKGRNEIGDITYKQLYIELMGRHSNIILVDKERQIILDCIKHVPPGLNSYRTVLPGHEYILPPAQNKRNPLEQNEEAILQVLDFNRGNLDKQIVEHFAGISPLLAKEMKHRAGLANRVTIPPVFMEIMNQLKNDHYEPTISKNDEKEHFYLFPITYLKNKEEKTFSTLSSMLDRFYFRKASRDRVKQQGQDLERFVKNELTKNTTKIAKLKKTLKDAENAEKYQLYGELLTANIYLLKKGMKTIDVVNYYDKHQNHLTIPLDPKKTPAQNAQFYYAKYQKAKNALVVVQEQIEKANKEIDYFDHLLQQLNSADPKDLDEIREELIEEGYIRLKQKQKKLRKKHIKPNVERYKASDGTEILVGKNNKQNDYLTNQLAKRDDIWLHTKDIPGSHVVIKSKAPTAETIMEAANIAAYYSKARESSMVPVDFTAVKHVKKPNGAKPGFVIYDHQETVYVTPDADKLKEMKNGST